MDPRKKRIYLIIIAVCMLSSAGILIWSQNDFTSNEPPGPPIVQVPSGGGSAATGSADAGSGFRAPAVFPNNDSFNIEGVNSSEYMELRPYTVLDITGQLGRPDPFVNY